MRRLTTRVEKAEQAVKPRPVLIHVFPNKTQAAAIAAHERTHGPIPKDAHIIVIHHTFTSRL